MAPSFVAFRQSKFLALSITMNETSGASRYRLAATGFDHHIAHLIRPCQSARFGFRPLRRSVPYKILLVEDDFDLTDVG